MANIIADRVKYFLRQYPPFDGLEEEWLDKIVADVSVKYFPEDQLVFTQGHPQGDYWYVVRQGEVGLFSEEDGSRNFVDKCEAGDIFGIRSLISGDPYRLTALCAEECLIYQVNKEIFLELFQTNIEFSNYFARGYAQGQAVVTHDKEDNWQLGAMSSFERFDGRKDVLTAPETTTIQEASLKMKDRNVGSIVIVDDRSFPIGILTDTDLRNKVVAAGLETSSLVKYVMASPVKTIVLGLTHTELVIAMIKLNAHHLVVTEDGTIDSPVIGLVSDHDLMMAQGNHPAALIKQIRSERDLTKLPGLRDRAHVLIKSYLENTVSIDLVAGFITEVNDQIIKKAIQAGLKKVAQTFPDIELAPFAWLSLGSEGREEQLLRTDQDNALVYSDEQADLREAFLQLAEFVNQSLEDCGFEKCPADIMARNPSWCQPISKWRSYFSDWILQPDPQSVMHSTIFFDYRPVYGDPKLVQALDDHLKSTIESNEIFLNFLAQNALQNPPPVGFFKSFLVEKDGAHKDQFDIKARAMMPIADIARLLSLSKGHVDKKNTVDRLEAAKTTEPNHSELLHECAEVYKMLMKSRALSGMIHQDSGRYIRPSELNKLKRQILKKSFEPIKELQEVIHIRYQLAYFNR